MLTENSQHFPQPSETGKYYYESIQINVNISGLFIISSKSRSDLSGYIYKNSFNPLNPTENLLELDDNGCSDNQFKLLIALEVNTKYILVVTTSQANVTGTFSIIVTGPTKAVLERTNISSTSTSISTATAFTTTTKPSYACMTYYPTWMLIMICSIINLMKKLI
ncbi:unnamed protein product [Adineta steineri]|uniref:Uncharacterized protein n=1 Tax=Adineta steineri TaxID=433720 RepID=A0A819S1F6_9BILA|nr:unnamed protein product [Adineta steineri]